MKFIKLLFAILAFTICSGASAEIDVSLLTRGGWNCGSQRCYFFEADGTCAVVGSDTVSMKWAVEHDGSLILSDDEGNTEYMEITGSSARWRDGREGYHRPFAEKNNEIYLRQRREFPDLTWYAPHSANMLADKLYRKNWMSNTKDVFISFLSTDTCVLSDLNRKNLSQKYLWKTIDAESVRLTALQPPYGSKIVKVKMHPDAFDLTDDGETKHFILHAYYKMDALGATFDMCNFPLGCYGFFSDSLDVVKSYFDKTFPSPNDVADFSIFIVGYLWTCDGVIITQNERSVSYVNYPGDNTAIDTSFQYMTTILNNIFSPADIPSEDNIRIFIDQSPGRKAQLQITLLKVHDFIPTGDRTEKGFVSLTIRAI